QVQGLKWIDAAHVALPMYALTHAEQQGKTLGDQIVSQGIWSHIHFIAHSAGAGLIQKAAERIKSSLLPTTIQCTVLDPYDGALLQYATVYGNGADWTDNYFSRDLDSGVWTQQPLLRAYNADVTTLDPQSVHSQL